MVCTNNRTIQDLWILEAASEPGPHTNSHNRPTEVHGPLYQEGAWARGSKHKISIACKLVWTSTKCLTAFPRRQEKLDSSGSHEDVFEGRTRAPAFIFRMQHSLHLFSEDPVGNSRDHNEGGPRAFEGVSTIVLSTAERLERHNAKKLQVEVERSMQIQEESREKVT